MRLFIEGLLLLVLFLPSTHPSHPDYWAIKSSTEEIHMSHFYHMLPSVRGTSHPNIVWTKFLTILGQNNATTHNTWFGSHSAEDGIKPDSFTLFQEIVSTGVVATHVIKTSTDSPHTVKLDCMCFYKGPSRFNSSILDLHVVHMDTSRSNKPSTLMNWQDTVYRDRLALLPTLSDARPVGKTNCSPQPSLLTLVH